jgi:hypothetical protein
MPICSTCKLNRSHPCGPLASNDNRKAIIVACDKELRRPVHFSRMGMACSGLTFSRRGFADELANTLYLYEGDIYWPQGDIFSFHDTAIEDAFSNDLGFRWLSDFARVQTPPSRAPQYRLVARLRLIDTYFLIKRPNIARHFYR